MIPLPSRLLPARCLAAGLVALGLCLAAAVPLAAQTTPSSGASAGAATPATTPSAEPPAQAAGTPPAASAAVAAPAPSAAPPSAPAPTPAPAPPPTVLTPDPGATADDAHPVELKARPVAIISGSAGWDDGYKDVMGDFAKIRAALGKAGIAEAGRPFTVFLQSDDKGFKYDAEIPIGAAPAGQSQLSDEVKFGMSPAGRTLKFVHHGAYDGIDATYEAISAYLDEKGIQAKDLFIEQYANEPKDPDDPSLAVDIYIFIP